jgi:hypothetical protein
MDFMRLKRTTLNDVLVEDCHREYLSNRMDHDVAVCPIPSTYIEPARFAVQRYGNDVAIRHLRICLSCFLPGNLPGNYQILPKTSDLGQSCGKVHDCGKLPPLLIYPTLPYLTAVQKSVFQYHRKSTE